MAILQTICLCRLRSEYLNHSTKYKQRDTGFLTQNYSQSNHIQIISMYNLALNNPQGLVYDNKQLS